MKLTEHEIIKQTNVNTLFMYGLTHNIHYRFVDRTHFTYDGKFYITNSTQVKNIDDLVSRIKTSDFLFHIYYDDLIEDSYSIMHIKTTERNLIDSRNNKIYNIRKRIFEEKMKPIFEKEYKLLK